MLMQRFITHSSPRPSSRRTAGSLLLLVALLCAVPGLLGGQAARAESPSATATSSTSQASFTPRQIVVKLYLASDLVQVARDNGLGVVPIDQFGTRPIYRLRIRDGVDPLMKAQQLEADARVEYAEPNFIIRPPEWVSQYSWAKVDSPGSVTSQWAPKKINLSAAHAAGPNTTGAGITVAVLDTGIDRTHPMLRNRLVPGYDFVDMDADPSEEGAYDVNAAYGHGTHVAGLVALVAPDARIMPVRVLDPNGRGNIWVIAEALRFAVDPDGDEDTPDGADVINLSLSSPRQSDLLADVVGDAICQVETDDDCLSTAPEGTVIIAAAGNSGTTRREYPAAEDESGLLAVAASTPGDFLAGFSTRGAWVDVAAPGKNIVSSMPEGKYASWNGTSMSAGIVSGLAAIVRSTHPDWKWDNVTDHIMATAAEIPGSVPRRIDAYVAVTDT